MSPWKFLFAGNDSRIQTHPFWKNAALRLIVANFTWPVRSFWAVVARYYDAAQKINVNNLDTSIRIVHPWLNVAMVGKIHLFAGTVWSYIYIYPSFVTESRSEPSVSDPPHLEGPLWTAPKIELSLPCVLLSCWFEGPKPCKTAGIIDVTPPSWLLLAALSPQEHHQKSTWELIWASYELSPCLSCVKSTQEGLRAIMKGVRVTIRDDEGF